MYSENNDKQYQQEDFDKFDDREFRIANIRKFNAYLINNNIRLNEIFSIGRKHELIYLEDKHGYAIKGFFVNREKNNRSKRYKSICSYKGNFLKRCSNEYDGIDFIYDLVKKLIDENIIVQINR